MTKRLYIVRVEFEFAVIAESEQRATRFAEDALNDMDTTDVCTAFRAELGPTGEVTPPDGWSDDTLVYCSGNEDITFEQAVAEYTENK